MKTLSGFLLFLKLMVFCEEDGVWTKYFDDELWESIYLQGTRVKYIVQDDWH